MLNVFSDIIIRTTEHDDFDAENPYFFEHEVTFS